VAYRAAVAGASGYTGAELLRLLESHPGFSTTVATSREFAGRRVADVYPNLRTDLTYTELDPSALEDADVAFLALPHGASMEIGARLAKAGVAVVDLSADFRLKDAALYPEWFGKEHAAPETLGDWAYGLPELNRDEIKKARAIANPGCYPTAAILALAPLVQAGLIDPASIVVSAASGVSGAGRKLTNDIHFSHVHANFKAYGLPTHKHTPEIEQELGAIAGSSVRITFIPHLVPMPRGLLATCVADATGDGDPAAAAHAMYDGEQFVHVLDGAMPETKYTLGSNQCLLGYSHDARTGRTIAVAAIDNLGKGAAGQALQNANLVLGLPEDEGLTGGGLYP
jgi:N-acetyl-gamma-glutamyl-phosphate reductase